MATALLIKHGDWRRSNNRARQSREMPRNAFPFRAARTSPSGQRGPSAGRAPATAGLSARAACGALGGRRGRLVGEPGSPEEVEGALVDLAALPQALPRVLLLPAAQHELLVGAVALRAVVVGRGLQHGRADSHLQRGRAAMGAARLGAGRPRCPAGEGPGGGGRSLTSCTSSSSREGTCREPGMAAPLSLSSPQRLPATAHAPPAGGGGSTHARRPREAGLRALAAPRPRRRCHGDAAEPSGRAAMEVAGGRYSGGIVRGRWARRGRGARGRGAPPSSPTSPSPAGWRGRAPTRCRRAPSTGER